MRSLVTENRLTDVAGLVFNKVPFDGFLKHMLDDRQAADSPSPDLMSLPPFRFPLLDLPRCDLR